ncbi:DUF4817 domain-containing protein [Trichonephila clavipes]|uniref:DUF4817 domain-containing protein n=1 Tax=Trichonephila clavipes TaxID=2585209 RepID=A0A8X7BMD9_TRICX|nr:DUF4817 domain-containing protein [Trichonephila clavipes]
MRVGSSDCRRQLIWRESGTVYRPENIQEKDRYPTCSIMVWAGIMINGRTRLHVVANGTMTGQRYIDEVLLPHVRLFRGAVGDKFVFMDDNATCHRTLAVQDCLDSEGIQRLVWPARSADLNPIENVWDALGKQVAGRNYPPTNKNTLIRALTEEWDKLPQQLLDNVVQKTKLGPDSQLKIRGFDVFRTDRPDSAGDGLAFLIRGVNYNSLSCQSNNPDLEIQGITLNWKNKPFNISNLYHPSNQRTLVNDISGISDELTIILGDLKAKHTLWGCSEINKRGEDLLDFFDDRALLVLNDGTPPHSLFSYNTKEALDIAAATSDIYPRCKWSALRSIGSNHLLVLIEVEVKFRMHRPKENFWNFRKFAGEVILHEREESATIALHKFRVQKNLKSGKGPLTPAGLLKLVKRFEETGKLEDRARAGRPCLKEARAPCIAVEMEAIASEAASGTSSASEAARQLGLPPSSVRNILRRILQLYPYKLQSCHELLPADTAQMEAFAKWAFSKMEQDPIWVYNILWTDEAHFSFHGDVNNYNCRIWVTSNPREYTQKPLHSPKVTAWCGFTGSFIIGPFFFETQCPVNG